jgi:hypothetical protein
MVTALVGQDIEALQSLTMEVFMNGQLAAVAALTSIAASFVSQFCEMTGNDPAEVLPQMAMYYRSAIEGMNS